MSAMQVHTTYEELAEMLAAVGRSDAAAEYHGALCGALCVAKPDDIDLLRLIETDGQPLAADAATRAALVGLREATVEALQDSELGFTLLLPDDEAALMSRARALSVWCEGFLYGLASQPGLDLNRLSAEAREIVRDLTDFTQASVGETDDLETEESAYTELVEYLRIGAQLLYMELHPRPTLDPDASSHLH